MAYNLQKKLTGNIEAIRIALDTDRVMQSLTLSAKCRNTAPASAAESHSVAEWPDRGTDM